MSNSNLKKIGLDWMLSSVDGITDHIGHVTPSAFNESVRYLPESVTSMPGYIRYAINPFMREIVDCFDVDSPVREVSVMKGVQITYTTALESGVLYYMAHVKTLPIMYMTADKELATARVENNFIPMINQSDLSHIVRSSDEGNTRKTGKTINHIQFAGGGYLVPFGARNADKMRSYSICVMLKDEIDAWPDTVGRDGDPDALSDARCLGYWDRRKIFRGSTPLIKGMSKIEKAFLRGDQRHYMVRCKKCNFQQALRWSTKDDVGGFKWELQDGVLLQDSVRYCCQSCGEPHFEHDKTNLFATEHGAEWVPTATPDSYDVRSYHLPALYSPYGMQPWYQCVTLWLDSYDTETRHVKDPGKLQVFYNNILAESFEIMGSKVSFSAVSAHRRTWYTLGHIPNKTAMEHLGGAVLFLTCTVDVHKSFLAVAVIGWAIDAKNLLIDYLKFEVTDREPDCTELSSPVWGKLRQLIEEKEYTADDGIKYRIHLTLIDASYSTDTVVGFCGAYASGVYPVLGRDRPAKAQRISEFAEFTTQSGTIGYRIFVDHYKDRLAPVLRREWHEQDGIQRRYHFNAPVDLTDDALKELTIEQRREKRDAAGVVSYYWHRPGNARNELWDLLVYGHAAVEIIAWNICVKHFELETVNWPEFWQFMLEQLMTAQKSAKNTP
jgi:phage terminase large subunit GpA-like protein